MKKQLRLISITALLVFGLITTSFAQSQSQTSNSISGFVLDAKSRVPIADVYVELLDDNYSYLNRTKTDGSGRFLFAGISGGNFKVRVLPYGTNYLEESQDVSIINNRLGNSVTSDRAYADFYMRPDPRKIAVDVNGTAGAVFVQEIPQQAQKLYKTALSNFGKPEETDLGFENLQKALTIFPDYYDALNRISIEYSRRSKFYETLPYLVKAISINKRSFSCFYMLGYSAYNLKQYKESVEAYKLAIVLNPDSAIAYIQLGMVQRIIGSYKDSEQTLLKAVSLSKDLPVPEVFWQLGLLYDKLERFDEAANQLEKYVKYELDTNNKQAAKNTIVSLRKKALNKQKTATDSK